MTRDEIVTALRCCAEGECHGCTIYNDKQRCQERVLDAAADLIENQQREIEVLRWANEEMSELAKELCKRCRGRDNVEAIAEEIADVEIMLQQLVILFDCKGTVDKYRQYKLERLAGRIEEAREEKHGTTD